MKTKRKTWYLQKKDILYVEENHDGKYGAKGKERLPKRKLTPEDVQRVNAWNKSKRARLRLMEYFSPGDLWVTFTYKPENRPPDMDTAKKQFLKMMDKLRKIYRKKGRVLFWIRNIERGTKGAWHIHCIINDIGNTASLVERAWPYGGVYVTQIRKSKCPEEDFQKLADYITKDEKTREKKKTEPVDLVLVTDGSEVASDAVYQSAWNGLAQYGDESGLKYEASVPAGRTTEDYENTIKEAAQKGASVIVCAGTSMSRAVYDAQRDWKDVRFLLLEAEPVSESGRSRLRGNTESLEIDVSEAGYLAGYAAVQAGYTHLGYIGQKNEENGTKYGTGYALGAEAAAAGSGPWRKQHHAGLYVSEKQQRITVVFGKNQKLVW